ncbi:28455_t:CDS:2, partial [Dentiscutata erythropus]
TELEREEDCVRLKLNRKKGNGKRGIGRTGCYSEEMKMKYGDTHESPRAMDEGTSLETSHKGHRH